MGPLERTLVSALTRARWLKGPGVAVLYPVTGRPRRRRLDLDDGPSVPDHRLGQVRPGDCGYRLNGRVRDALTWPMIVPLDIACHRSEHSYSG